MAILHSAVLSLGLISLRPIVAGMRDFSKASVVLITLEIPLAASEWPTFVLTCCDDETVSTDVTWEEQRDWGWRPCLQSRSGEAHQPDA